jgi:hypothetical protein
MIGGKIEEFSSNTIPTPSESVYENVYEFHDNLLFGKLIEPDDVSYMIRNVEWTPNRKYDIYDDKDGDLFNKDFYVVSEQTDGSYGVFKCIYKNPISNPDSVNRPVVNQTNPSDEIYITGDGYQWKFMFSINSTQYDKFATSSFVPVFENENVVNNAVSGTIDSIIIENPGAQYNNYTSGTIKEAAIGGDLLKFSLRANDFFEVNTYDLIYSGNGTFSENETVDIIVPGESAVQGQIYKVGPTSISIVIDENTETITQSTVESSNDFIEVTNSNTSADVIRIRSESLPNLSKDENFYKDSIIYIRDGAGVGQVRDIIEYTIEGDDRIITINDSFETLPDTTSSFDILPKINVIGDGDGVIALPVIDTTANSVVDIEIINRGAGYSFADTNVTGNTGIIDANGSPVIANTAILRPIIAPAGGHGANAIRELYGTNIGVSTTFSNTEVLSNVSYSKIGIIRDLLHDNVVLTLDALSEEDYVEGELIRQEDPTSSIGLSRAQGTVKSIDSSANELSLTNVLGAFEVSSNNQIVGDSSNSTVIDINRNTNVFNNETRLGILLISGSFEKDEIVVQQNSNANGYIIEQTSNFLDVVQTFGDFTTKTSDVLVGQTSGATAIVSSITDEKIVDNSGDTIYIENTNKIDRSENTSEQIKLIIKF